MITPDVLPMVERMAKDPDWSPLFIERGDLDAEIIESQPTTKQKVD